MKRKRLAILLGLAALIVALAFGARSAAWLRESWLISIVRDTPSAPAEDTVNDWRAARQAEAATKIGKRRRTAMQALGELRSVRAIPVLIASWGQPTSDSDLLATIKALAAIGSPAVPYLERTLREGTRQERILAEIVLKEITLPGSALEASE